MRTIAIINQKGGCGKTTTAINLAAVLASQGRRTLLVDMDPQSHCALGLAVPESQLERSVFDLLNPENDGKLSTTEVVWQISRHLDLAPSNMALATLEAELMRLSDRDKRLKKVLDPIDDRYEYCIIDCPPSIGLLTFNALRAANEVLVPVETGYFALQGAIKQEATIEMLARRAHHNCRFRILPTMYDVRTKLAREVLTEMKRHFGPKMLPVTIHFNIKLKEAVSVGQAITEFDSASRGMADFEKLVDWLLANPPELELPAPPEERQTEQPSPISRAAELVERARALAQRTQSLSARLDSDPALQAAGVATAPPIRVPQAPAANQPVPAPAQSRPVPAAPTAPAASSATNGQAVAQQNRANQTNNETQAPTSAAAAVQAELQARLNGQTGPAVEPEPPMKTREETARKLQRIFGVRRTHEGLLFVQPANGTDHEIYIAGDFNNWQPRKTPLRRNEDLGVWEAAIPVTKPGRYEYRLVVDGEWMPDPYNQQTRTNPFGEENSVVEVNTG